MLRYIKIHFNIFVFFRNKSRQILNIRLVFNHDKKQKGILKPPTFMKKIYHTNQKKSIAKFCRGPPL